MGFLFESEDNTVIDNPNLGFAELSYSQAQKKFVYKANDGITRTLATGVTIEEVQDILGQSLNDSSTLNWTYDDENDSFTAELDQSVIQLIDSKVSQQNLQSSVRSTILTGLNLAISTAVLASDSVLSAFGKIQAQLNILLARVFGTGAEDFFDDTQVNFSGTISLQKSFTTQNKIPGRYRVAALIQFEPAQGSTNDIFDLRVNGQSVTLQFNNEPKDTGADVRNVISLWGYYNHSALGTFDIEIWGGNQNGTTELNSCLAEVWRQS